MSQWKYKNRIVGNDEVPPDQLVANPYNWRTHGKDQREALNGSLRSVGWVQQVIVNRVTGHVVDGHARVELALQNNEPTIPVLYVELSENEEKLILATLDPIGALAGRDVQLLEQLMREVSTDDAALQKLLADMAEDAGIVPPDLGGDDGGNDEGNYSEQYGVIVMCENAGDQEEKYNALVAMGYECKVVCT